jgi:tetraacyldisaccharide 4'-kinase
LITGIANPKPLKSFVAKYAHSYELLRYADHHIFNSGDLKDIQKQFEKIKSTNKIIITTEKDGVRLEKFKSELAHMPIYILPIKHSFLFDEGEQFKNEIVHFIDGFTKP